jgi:U32 family peptidase
MKRVEILAPAGSYESLVAAVNAGADAIYIGGSQFGARANANNLNEVEMLHAIDYVHIHNKKIYLTVNTLLKNDEVKNELYDYVLKFYMQGLDAVIIQDLGVMNYIHKNFPDLPIHASTQMTLTMAEGVNVFKHLGVTRLVTARELSLGEVKEFGKNTDIELESFVHGSLCYCYSGQCLMSSMLGGRSGNRGRCAQPCRMPYTLKKDGKILSKPNQKYLLSPKDICTLDMIPDLVEAGIDSFKIEGRMKRPEYTALTTLTYRKYIDFYIKLGKAEYIDYIDKHQEEFQGDIRRLMDLYNRGGFSTGYYDQYNAKSMMAMDRPNHSGLLVGKVIDVKNNKATFELYQNINSQDILEFRDKNNETLYEYTVKNSALNQEIVEANFKYGSNIKIDDLIYRTKNQSLLEYIEKKYLIQERKELIHGLFRAVIGEPMKLEISCGETLVSVSGDIVEASQKQPITREKLQKQLTKTNTTSFQFENLEFVVDDNIFIQISKINEIRRSALALLVEALLSKHKRKKPILSSEVIKEETIENSKNKRGIHVSAMSLQQVSVVVNFKEVDFISICLDNFEMNHIRKAIDLVKNSKQRIYLLLPNILRKETYQLLETLFLKLEDVLKTQGLGGFIVKNHEEYHFIQKYLLETKIDKEIILDHNMYTLNKESKKFWNTMGVYHFTASVELNRRELDNLGCKDMDLIVYGYLPLMTSAQCLVKNTIGCDYKPGLYKLQDRQKKEFFCLNHCHFCYNIIYNIQPVSLIKYKTDIDELDFKNIRLDFTIESQAETESIIRDFIQVFYYNKSNINLGPKEYTKGHFKRGIE